MNASATIRASYVQASRMSIQPSEIPDLSSIRELTSRPAQSHKLAKFEPVNHIEHRDVCEKERTTVTVSEELFWSDTEKGFRGDKGTNNTSFMDFDDSESVKKKLVKMFTVFPYRDPIYLVAVVFAIGSLDLVLNSFFDLIPRTHPELAFETEETIAVPATVLIGSILFFTAGIFDTFGALNADRGTLETSKDADGNMGKTEYRPALLGSSEWRWFPSGTKFRDLASTNLAFQAGLIVLFGGVIFMFAGIVDFPGLVPETVPGSQLIIFAPQIIHGFMFLIANVMLAVATQERWWIPKFCNADWLGSFLNAIGGFAFMLVGFFLFRENELTAAIMAMIGSFAFFIGSLVRWYATMEFC